MAEDIAPGRLAEMEVSEDAVTTPFVTIGGNVDLNHAESVDSLDCTTRDSLGKRESIPGHSEATIDMTGKYLDGDPGMEIVIVATVAKTRFDYRFYMDKDPGSGKRFWSGKGHATSNNKAGPLDDTGNIDITIQCSLDTVGIQ